MTQIQVIDSGGRWDLAAKRDGGPALRYARDLASFRVALRKAEESKAFIEANFPDQACEVIVQYRGEWLTPGEMELMLVAEARL